MERSQLLICNRTTKRDLKEASYYKKLCEWILANTSEENAKAALSYYTQCGKDVMKCYDLETCNFYSEHLKFCPVERFSIDEEGIVISNYGRYTYYPLNTIPCLGLLYALIQADSTASPATIEIGEEVLSYLKEIAPDKAEEVLAIIADKQIEIKQGNTIPQLSNPLAQKSTPHEVHYHIDNMNIGNNFGDIVNHE